MTTTLYAPLYTGAAQWMAENDNRCPCPADAHKGLWFDRFFNQFDAKWNIPKPDKKAKTDPKRDWIKRTVAGGACGDHDALRCAALRRLELVETLGGKVRCFETDWHFSTGLGLPHPVENGFAWHPTLGVPYLTGAAVKGLVRAFLEFWTNLAPEAKQARLLRWFGSDDKEPSRQREEVSAGTFVFFDALPIYPSQLTCDIVTPHMGDWYEKGTVNPLDPGVTPGDWHDPNPIPFLAVRKATFLFAVAPRKKAKKSDADEACQDLAEVLDCLGQALDWLGAGAKTAVGYGRMQRDEDQECKLKVHLEEVRKKRADMERLAKLSP